MIKNRLLKKVIGVFYYTMMKLWLTLKITLRPGVVKGESYYPELVDRQKSKIRIWFEQIIYIWKYHSINEFYYLYGFDIKNLKKETDFIDNAQFIRQRSAMNRRFLEFPPIPVLRDKALFGVVAAAYGINTPKNVGVIHNHGVFLFETKERLSLDDFLKQKNCLDKGDYFIKKIDGECGDGVFHVEMLNGELFYKGDLVEANTFFEENNRYLIQEAIRCQHPAISVFHNKAINTLRLVTVYDEKKQTIEVFSCVLRIGTGSNNVDNWAVGGLSVGVDTEKGIMRKYGFYKPGFGTKTTEHPDSHIEFEGYEIPFIKEAIIQAKAFHHHLYGIHSVGWDIAITEDGPCFVEGNDNWEISLMQISNYGLKKEFDQFFK